MQNLRAAVDLLNEIDPRNFTREERKQMADMVVKLMGIIEGEGTTETSTQGSGFLVEFWLIY